MPRHGRGLYPLKACVQWYLAYCVENATGRKGNADENTEERRYKNQILRVKAEAATGDMISRAEVVMVWSSALARYGKAIGDMPRKWGRDLNLSSDLVKTMVADLNALRESLVRDSAEYVEVVEEKPDVKRAKKRS